MTAFGLNQYLMPENSPIAKNQGQVSSYQFDYENESALISSRKIANFNFSQGQGGTLSLGGTNNGNGILLIKNSLGGTAVSGGSAGLKIYNDGGTQNVEILSSDGQIRSAYVNVWPFDSLQGAAFRVYSGTSPTNPVFDIDAGSYIRFGDSTFIDGQQLMIENNGYLDIQGTVDRSNPGDANTARLFVDDSGGGGKRQLKVIFNTGTAIVLATEP